MVSSFFKVTLRQIKHNKSRFISIIAIILLGVGFVTGLYILNPSTKYIINNHYDKSNSADLIIIKNNGIVSDEDINKISNNKVSNITLSGMIEGNIKYNNKDFISRFYIYNNKDFSLLEGRLPQDKNEVLVQKGGNNYESLDINEEIIYNEEKLKIVGIVINPWYMSKEKEKSFSNPHENINTIIYRDSNYLEFNYYNQINIYFKDNSNTFSKEYKNNSLEIKNEVKSILGEDYVFISRNENIGYSFLEENFNKIQSIIDIFPILFFLVVILVVLTTMTRMVEEERLLIGLFKALGYNNLRITFKYIFYILVASLIGIVFGVGLGLVVLPYFVYGTFHSLFYLPKYEIYLNITNGLIISILILLSVLVTTFYVCRKSLKETSANLLVERAPKPGKRILLERISFFWKRLNFKYKASLRNVFRYKKHLVMTLIGVVGSSALVFAGLALDVSIRKISEVQYNDIVKYDGYIKANNIKDINIDDYIDNKIEIYSVTKGLSKEVDGSSILSFNLVVYDKDIYSFFDIHNYNNERIDISNNGVIVSKRILDVFDYKIGNTITLNNKDLKILDVAENYVNNYIFISKDLYKEVFVDEYKENTIFFILKDNVNIDDMRKNLYQDYSFIDELVYTKEIDEANKKMTSQVSIIVTIIVLSAAGLAILVIYNLTNVNIGERYKELSTLKVLGYSQIEVSGYIFREGMMLTIIGGLFGLLCGYFLHGYIVDSLNSDLVIFGHITPFYIYVLTYFLTIIFTLIVYILMYFKIKKINMFSSLY